MFVYILKGVVELSPSESGFGVFNPKDTEAGLMVEKSRGSRII